MRRLFIIYSLFLMAFLIFACKTRSEYTGYNKHTDGFFFKLVKIGDDGVKCAYNDYITADIAYSTINDSVFFKGRRKFQISEQQFQGSIDECLTLMSKDDSASFIIPVTDFFRKTLSMSELPSFLKDGDRMKINISILDLQTPKQYTYEKEAFVKWTEDFGAYEKTLIRQFLDGTKINVTPLPSGMYYFTLKKGNTKTVLPGDTVNVHYEGKFLNGKYFDSTRQRKEAFQFVYGQQMQVIKGLEDAISMMHEGEKALFIMPSELAFGEIGSSTGIIPPFTSLIFEVELISIHKNPIEKSNLH